MLNPIKKWLQLPLFFLFAFPTFSFANTVNPITKVTYDIRYQIQVHQLLNQINPQNLFNNDNSLTQFPDRGANHNTGVAAENWIQTELEKKIKASGRQDASIFTIDTVGKDPISGQSFIVKQPSVVLKIGTSSAPGIVLGAHFDTKSCNYFDEQGYHDDDGCLKDQYGPYPGANDDGSGASTLLETANVLLNSHMQFNKPLYLIFYAAEEYGSYGSIAVVDYFKKNKMAIDAVLQLDQTGFAYNNDPMMYLETNKGLRDKVVNDQLTQYLSTLIKTYVHSDVKKPVQLSCSGTSDEYTWTSNGFVAARPLESDYCNFDHMYHYMHTNQDTIGKLSLTHMTDYLKLEIAFAVELAEPISHSS